MSPSNLVMQAFVIFGLILVSSHVGECSKLMFPMFEVHKSYKVPSPASAPTQIPAYSPESIPTAPAPVPVVAPDVVPTPVSAPVFVPVSAPIPVPTSVPAPAPVPVLLSAPVPVLAPVEVPAPTFAPTPSSEPAPDLGLGPAAAPGSASSPGPVAGPSGTPGLWLGFYKEKCGNVTVDVEAIISSKLQEAFIKDPTILPALLRLTFHDCFVTGCDASLTINGTSTEMTNENNLSVRGYDVIEAIKAAVEAECPGVVSCSDIIALSTGFAIQLGGGPAYSVETGRRDGLVSKSSDVVLPGASMNVTEGAALFATKNFTAEEMAILLGAHAVGIAHCGFFQDRLYPDTSLYDPLMDDTLRSQLETICPQKPVSGNFTRLNQDPENNNVVDNSFYNQLVLNRGLLPIDQALSRDPSTSGLVSQLAANRTEFNIKFANAMIKLQALDVLTGNEGEIRNVCSKFN